MISWILSLFSEGDNDFLDHSIDDDLRQKYLSRLRMHRLLAWGTGILFIIICVLENDWKASGLFSFFAIYMFSIMWDDDAEIKMVQLFEKMRNKPGQN